MPQTSTQDQKVIVLERSRCQSFQSAFRAHILIGECDDEREAMELVEDWTDDSYCCFALTPDGCAIDIFGRYPGAVDMKAGACA